jgi:hypothetical protein
MTGDNRTRHCSQCNQNVYHLSELTRQQAEDLVRSKEGRLCVRFYRRRDGTLLTRDCRGGWRRLGHRIALTVGVFFGAVFALVSLNQPRAHPRQTQNGGLRGVEPFRTLLEWIDPTPQCSMGVPAFRPGISNPSPSVTPTLEVAPPPREKE